MISEEIAQESQVHTRHSRAEKLKKLGKQSVFGLIKLFVSLRSTSNIQPV